MKHVTIRPEPTENSPFRQQVTVDGEDITSAVAYPLTVRYEAGQCPVVVLKAVLREVEVDGALEWRGLEKVPTEALLAELVGRGVQA